MRDAIQAAVAAVDDGLSRTLEDPFMGSFRVGSLGVVTDAFVIPSLIELKREHPRVGFPESLNLRTSEATAMLARGQIDVAFYYEDLSVEGIVVERLGTTPMSVYCGREHPLFKRRKLKQEHVLEHPFSVPQVGDTGQVMDGWPSELPREIGMRITLLRSNLQVCRSGASADRASRRDRRALREGEGASAHADRGATRHRGLCGTPGVPPRTRSRASPDRAGPRTPHVVRRPSSASVEAGIAEDVIVSAIGTLGETVGAERRSDTSTGAIFVATLRNRRAAEARRTAAGALETNLGRGIAEAFPARRSGRAVDLTGVVGACVVSTRVVIAGVVAASVIPTGVVVTTVGATGVGHAAVGGRSIVIAAAQREAEETSDEPNTKRGHDE